MKHWEEKKNIKTENRIHTDTGPFYFSRPHPVVCRNPNRRKRRIFFLHKQQKRTTNGCWWWYTVVQSNDERRKWNRIEYRGSSGRLESKQARKTKNHPQPSRRRCVVVVAVTVTVASHPFLGVCLCRRFFRSLSPSPSLSESVGTRRKKIPLIFFHFCCFGFDKILYEKK